MKEQIAPDRFVLCRIAADQPRHQMIVQQRDDRRTARADRVCIARPAAAVTTADRQQNGFLHNERLDGVRAPHFGLKVDLPDFDVFDCGHVGSIL